MMKGVNLQFTATNRAGPAMKSFQAGLTGARTQLTAASIANRRFSQSLGGSTWRRQVQQAGMQISDFSVQVAGGQSAILAFTQNAPQFLQNFGAMGGVIAAAVTILGTFAFMASRGTLETENLGRVAGVLAGVFERLGSVFMAVKDAAGPALQVLLQNIDTLLIAATLTVGLFAVKFVAAMVAARVAAASTSVTMVALRVHMLAFGPAMTAVAVAVGLVSRALVIMRAILVSLGIPALIIGLSLLIERFLRLVQVTGSWGAALSLLGELASTVWDGMKMALSKAVIGIHASLLEMQADFLSVMAAIGSKWDSLTKSMATFWNDNFTNTVLGGQLGLGTVSGSNVAERLLGTSEALQSQADALRARADAMGDTFGAAKTKLQEIRDLMKEDPIEFGGGAGKAGDGGGGGKSASEKMKEEADKIKKTFEDMRDSISQSIMSSFKGLLDGTKSLADGITDILNNIISKMLDIFLMPIFDQFAGNITGQLFKGIIPGFASGTRSAPGGLARINERGGELAVLPGGTQVIPHDLSKRMVDNASRGGIGGPLVEVNVVNQSSAQVQRRSKRGPDGRETIDLLISDSITGGNQDAALRQRTGARVPKVAR